MVESLGQGGRRGMNRLLGLRGCGRASLIRPQFREQEAEAKQRPQRDARRAELHRGTERLVEHPHGDVGAGAVRHGADSDDAVVACLAVVNRKTLAEGGVPAVADLARLDDTGRMKRVLWWGVRTGCSTGATCTRKRPRRCSV